MKSAPAFANQTVSNPPETPQTAAALFDSFDEAAMAVAALEDAGIAHGDISIVSNKVERQYGEPAKTEGAASVAADGAGLGTLMGGGAGLLAGLGIIAIPGIGPVLAAGWLAATVVGAATGAVAGGIAGGLVGAMTRAGIDDGDAHVYAEGIRRGGTMVSVRGDAKSTTIAREILQNLDTVDLNARANLFRDNGWRQFDESERVASEEELARAKQDPRMPML
jgi:hypothetical protein